MKRENRVKKETKPKARIKSRDKKGKKLEKVKSGNSSSSNESDIYFYNDVQRWKNNIKVPIWLKKPKDKESLVEFYKNIIRKLLRVKNKIRAYKIQEAYLIDCLQKCMRNFNLNSIISQNFLDYEIFKSLIQNQQVSDFSKNVDNLEKVSNPFTNDNIVYENITQSAATCENNTNDQKDLPKKGDTCGVNCIPGSTAVSDLQVDNPQGREKSNNRINRRSCMSEDINEEGANDNIEWMNGNFNSCDNLLSNKTDSLDRNCLPRNYINSLVNSLKSELFKEGKKKKNNLMEKVFSKVIIPGAFFENNNFCPIFMRLLKLDIYNACCNNDIKFDSKLMNLFNVINNFDESTPEKGSTEKREREKRVESPKNEMANVESATSWYEEDARFFSGQSSLYKLAQYCIEKGVLVNEEVTSFDTIYIYDEEKMDTCSTEDVEQRWKNKNYKLWSNRNLQYTLDISKKKNCSLHFVESKSALLTNGTVDTAQDSCLQKNDKDNAHLGANRNSDEDHMHRYNKNRSEMNKEYNSESDRTIINASEVVNVNTIYEISSCDDQGEEIIEGEIRPNKGDNIPLEQHINKAEIITSSSLGSDYNTFTIEEKEKGQRHNFEHSIGDINELGKNEHLQSDIKSGKNGDTPSGFKSSQKEGHHNSKLTEQMNLTSKLTYENRLINESADALSEEWYNENMQRDKHIERCKLDKDNFHLKIKESNELYLESGMSQNWNTCHNNRMRKRTLFARDLCNEDHVGDTEVWTSTLDEGNTKKKTKIANDNVKEDDIVVKGSTLMYCNKSENSDSTIERGKFNYVLAPAHTYDQSNSLDGSMDRVNGKGGNQSDELKIRKNRKNTNHSSLDNFTRYQKVHNSNSKNGNQKLFQTYEENDSSIFINKIQTDEDKNCEGFICDEREDINCQHNATPKMKENIPSEKEIANWVDGTDGDMVNRMNGNEVKEERNKYGVIRDLSFFPKETEHPCVIILEDDESSQADAGVRNQTSQKDEEGEKKNINTENNFDPVMYKQGDDCKVTYALRSDNSHEEKDICGYQFDFLQIDRKEKDTFTPGNCTKLRKKGDDKLSKQSEGLGKANRKEQDSEKGKEREKKGKKELSILNIDINRANNTVLEGLMEFFGLKSKRLSRKILINELTKIQNYLTFEHGKLVRGDGNEGEGDKEEIVEDLVEGLTEEIYSCPKLNSQTTSIREPNLTQKKDDGRHDCAYGRGEEGGHNNCDFSSGSITRRSGPLTEGLPKSQRAQNLPYTNMGAAACTNPVKDAGAHFQNDGNPFDILLNSDKDRLQDEYITGLQTKIKQMERKALFERIDEAIIVNEDIYKDIKEEKQVEYITLKKYLTDCKLSVNREILQSYCRNKDVEILFKGKKI
ncbi:conserved Plasmodium protein, unknown function [Plasmodium ovale]|uniref:Uncharacterized protein n=2 Tax=Plasmodium ovale TaxID=36330 RepID=A0A1A8X2G5_PLAOA|nr:conserved Plasmodium protein, unknown function [Plasmodium ovale curtisi]SBS98362.1 conserved Plasmodium protein, unknown function [Plasmodium ovale curtisi]SCQ17059.1 conserved Plasmodium protein, unknown function [Plasmodium ovale]